jgi:GDP-D-mannose dehydratase
MDGIEEENIFQEEPSIEEEEQNFSTIENETVNIFQEEVTPEFEIPEQEGWTEEIEQTIESFTTPQEVEMTKIDVKTIEEPKPIRTITIDEEIFKPFEVDLVIQETKQQEEQEEVKPSFEVMTEKKNL